MDGFYNSENTSSSPRKRRREDDAPPDHSGSYESTQLPTPLPESQLPPRANRKQDQQHSLQCGTPPSTPVPGFRRHISPIVRPNNSWTPQGTVNAISIKQPCSAGSGHDGSESTLAHLQSLMLQCQRVSSQALFQQQQEARESLAEADVLRRQLQASQDELRSAKADLARTRDSLQRAERELSHVTQSWERDKEELRVQTMAGIAVKAGFAQLQNDLERMRQEKEKLECNDAARREECDRLREAQRSCAENHVHLVQDVEDAKQSAAVLADALEALKAGQAEAEAKAKKMEAENQELLILGRRSKELEQLRQTVASQKTVGSATEARATLAEKNLVSFHFGMNILSSYFLNLLRQCQIPKVSPRKKRRKEIGEEEHDLWDVQTAMKLLVEKLMTYVQEIRDRDDNCLDDYELGCPLCAAGVDG